MHTMVRKCKCPRVVCAAVRRAAPLRHCYTPRDKLSQLALRTGASLWRPIRFRSGNPEADPGNDCLRILRRVGIVVKQNETPPRNIIARTALVYSLGTQNPQPTIGTAEKRFKKRSLTVGQGPARLLGSERVGEPASHINSPLRGAGAGPPTKNTA